MRPLRGPRPLPPLIDLSEGPERLNRAGGRAPACSSRSTVSHVEDQLHQILGQGTSTATLIPGKMQQQLGAARVQGPRPLPAPPTSAAQPAASVPSVDPVSCTFEAPPARPNALEAVYGGRAPPDPFDWSLSQQQHDAPDSRGGTFFVSGSGTQRLGAAPARPGLAFAQDAPTFARHEQQPQQLPTFNDNTSYSPPRTPQQLPPGARPLPTPPQRQAPKPSSPSPPSTRIPLATSSSILLHSGFWQILSASGSRFLTSAPSPAVVAPQFPPGFGEDLERPYLPSPVRQGPAGKQSNLKKNKRISVDMVGSPRGFQRVSLTHLSASRSLR